MKYGTRQGFFFFPFLGSSQFSACCLREPAALPPASFPASSQRGWYPPHHSSLVVSWELAVPNVPSAPSRAKGRCSARLPSPAAETKPSRYTSGHPVAITALLFVPCLIRDDFAHGVVHPRGFVGSAWPSATPSRGMAGDGASHGTHSPVLSALASPAAPSVGMYLHRVCKSEHVIFPLSSPGEGLWPERSRQIFEAGSGEPAPTLRGSLASAGHSQIKDADFATRIGPWQPRQAGYLDEGAIQCLHGWHRQMLRFTVLSKPTASPP